MKIRKSRITLSWKYLIRLLAVWAICVLTATAATIFSQPPVWTPGNSVGNAVTDQIDRSGGGFKVFDNFRVDAPVTLRQVTWYGIYFDSQLGDALPSVTTSWEMEFLADNNGVPGSRLSYTGLSSSLVEIRNIGSGPVGNIPPVTVYQFTSNLHPFSVSAGTQYWFSVVSRADSGVPFFLWIAGTGGDGASYGHDYFNGAITSQQSVELDRAFSFNPVPEPSVFVPVAALLIAFVGFSRKASRDK